MNIGNITYLLTGLFEALMMSVLFDAFGKRRANIPDTIYILSIFILGILINVSNYIFNFSYTNAFAIIIISSFFSLLYNIKYIIGLIVAFLLLAALIYLLVRPYKESKKLGVKVKVTK